MVTKKGMAIIFFSPLSFIAVFGSEIRDPGWVKIRTRNTGFFLLFLGLVFLLLSGEYLNGFMMLDDFVSLNLKRFLNIFGPFTIM